MLQCILCAVHRVCTAHNVHLVMCNTQHYNTQCSNTQYSNTQCSNTQCGNTQCSNTQYSNAQLCNTHLNHIKFIHCPSFFISCLPSPPLFFVLLSSHVFFLCFCSNLQHSLIIIILSSISLFILTSCSGRIDPRSWCTSSRDGSSELLQLTPKLNLKLLYVVYDTNSH